MTLGHIRWVKTEVLGDVLAGIVRNGLTFNVTPEEDGTWNVELTGGH